MAAEAGGRWQLHVRLAGIGAACQVTSMPLLLLTIFCQAEITIGTETNEIIIIAV